MSSPIDRRVFMKRAAGAGATLSISMAGPLTRKALGANDRVRVGVIGTGRQGVSNLKAFKEHGAEIAAVCDVYAPNLEKGKLEAGPDAATYGDFRKLLDDKTIDVVINATPDHWHALPTVMACQAGKDVFVEKPISVAVEEGKAMVAAARKYQRVVQVGLWQRSNLALPARGADRPRGPPRQGHLRAHVELRQLLPGGLRQPARQRPARRARLGHVAGAGPEGAVQREPLRRGARSLVHLPPLLRLRERHAGRLGRAPRRHRPVGPRGPGAAGRHLHGLEVRDPGQRRHPRHPRRHLRVPRLRLHLREPPRQRQLDVREGLRHRVPRHRGHDVPQPLGLRGLPGDAEARGRARRSRAPRRCGWTRWTTASSTTSATCSSA